ncbi:MAG: FAD-dependent oxidoreductase [Abditibacteriaceae bacterium]
MNQPHTIHEDARDISIFAEVDICVLGGSCTGVFAAVRAARLGAKVALVEMQNSFGGVGTNSLVCVWHSLWDTEGKRQVISGLTEEVMTHLSQRGVVKAHEPTNGGRGFTFNPQELKIDLDELVQNAGIRSFLNTMFVSPHLEDGVLDSIVVENKSGRGAIKAKMFIDATGDGDLAARLGCETYYANHLQPATACALFSGWETLNFGGVKYQDVIANGSAKFNLPEGFAWGGYVPGSTDFMLAGTRVYGANPANADDLTAAEFEGRRQVRAIMDIFKEASPDSKLALSALPSRIGLRESRHVRCEYQLTGDDILHGRRFPDAIANGSYPSDTHHQDKPGITLRYLDGTEVYNHPGQPSVCGRWRKETVENPTFYQIPFRSMLPGTHPNLLIAGRMVDAEPPAHAAIRVMVNMNQTGEAAGVAAYLAMNGNGDVRKLDVDKLRSTLAQGGSIII